MSPPRASSSPPLDRDRCLVVFAGGLVEHGEIRIEGTEAPPRARRARRDARARGALQLLVDFAQRNDLYFD